MSFILDNPYITKTAHKKKAKQEKVYAHNVAKNFKKKDKTKPKATRNGYNKK